uniref:protein-serine/threonine phosphatase n=1 Tax=Fagus sylvatica TaxID=28930 RepID=A0A2N9IAR7_FAGSY
MGPSSSSVPTEAAVAAVGVAIVAAVMMIVGTAAAIVVAIILVVVLVVLGARWWVGCSGGVFHEGQIRDLDVEPQYSGARIDGDVVTLDFVKKMMDDFKNQKCLHKRYAFQIVLQMRDTLRALPSLVDINVPDGNHFTVCGDVHGQVEMVMKA